MVKKIQTSINELLDGDSGCCYMSKGAHNGSVLHHHTHGGIKGTGWGHHDDQMGV